MLLKILFGFWPDTFERDRACWSCWSFCWERCHITSPLGCRCQPRYRLPDPHLPMAQVDRGTCPDFYTFSSPCDVRPPQRSASGALMQNQQTNSGMNEHAVATYYKAFPNWSVDFALRLDTPALS